MGSDNNVVIPAAIPDPADGIEINEDELLVEGSELEPPKVEETPPKSAEDGIEELRRKLEADNARKLLEAEQRVAQAEEEASRYRAQAERGRVDNLANAVDLATQELDKQKAALQRAMEARDYEAAANAQAALSEAAAAKTLAVQARAAFEGQMRTREAQPKPQAQTFTPRTQAWLDAHPEVLTNPTLRQRAAYADGIARAEGLAVDADDYFARVEEILGMKREEAKQQRPAPAPAAPVSRGGAQAGADGKVKYHLSKEEREIADFSGVSYLEYAKNKAKMLAEQGR